MSAAPVEVPIESAPSATPATPASAAGVPELRGVPSAEKASAPADPAPVEKTGTWIDELAADDRAYVSTKGWDKEGKSPADILKSYRNLERLRGVSADQLIKKPDWNNAESVAEFRAALGVPADVSAYEAHEVEIPGGTIDVGRAAQISHKLGLTQQQHSAFLDEVGSYFRESIQSQMEDIGRRNAAELVELKKEWGVKYDEHTQSMNNAIAQAQIKDEEIEALKIAMGEAGARKFLARVGQMFGEHKRPVEGGTGPVLMTSDVAKAEITALRSDREFGQRLLNGDVEARRKWDELQRVAFGG